MTLCRPFLLAWLSASLLLAPAAFAAEPGNAPAATAAPVEPARLAIATRIALRLMPDGTYRQILGGSLNRIMDMTMDGVANMPIKTLAGMGGLDAAALEKMPSATLKQVTEILDPAYQQRTRTIMSVMTTEMANFVSTMEPSFRDGLAEAYATHFSAAQLDELERFFQTPTGALYARQALLLQTDPAVMARMQTMIPKMMQIMPDVMKKAAAATAGLPKQRTFADLTPAEKNRVAQLLGMDPAKVK